ncbi:hypothetical protein PLESTF_001917600 [Pleodorina starrii]|nr:hypothetical protein PLESTF_001917600 [Pleodorina starrii]
MHGMRDREQGSHDPPGGLTLVSGLTALFGAVVRSLDVPSEASWAQQALPRPRALCLLGCASATRRHAQHLPQPRHRATPPLPPHPRLTRRRRHALAAAASRAAPVQHPPLGFTLRGVELRTCRARAPLSALAPQRKHERATSQAATRLWRAPVSVLRSREPSRAVSPAVVHGLGTHVVHDSEENDGGSGSGHTIGSVGGGGGGACPPLPDPLMWSSTRRNDDGATTTAWRTDGPGGGGTASHAATSASAVHLLQSAATPPPPPPCCGNPPSGSDRGAGKCTGQACVTALGRLGSLPRLPGAEAPSGREKGRSEGGAVASLPAAAASGGGRASGGSDGHGVTVALVVAVDLAVCDAASAVAAPSSDDGLPSAQPPPARCNPTATTAAGGEAALAPPQLPPPPLLPPPLPRNGGPPGGGGGNALNDTASHCVSLPHSGPASRRMTAPAYGGEGRSGVSNGVLGAVMPPPLKNSIRHCWPRRRRG